MQKNSSNRVEVNLMENKEIDKHYMQIALKLASRGSGFVNPNPLVGAVVVNNGEIVGAGYHKFFGGPHAEVYALKEAGEKAKGADIYVTLEPCSHYGKTPPCAKAIVKAGIKRVVIGAIDPNPLVSGKGVKILKDANVEVVTGVMADKVIKMNEIFINYIINKTPFVILKSAVSLDGKIATSAGKSKWITGEESRLKVHEIRNRVMAIMVGIGTVIADNPLLTTRLKENCKSPKAVIVDSKLRIPVDSKIFTTIKDREIIVACTEDFDREKSKQLLSMGVNVLICSKDGYGRVDLKYLIRKLGEHGIDSILLEGGGSLNFSALHCQVVDKVFYFIAPKLIGGRNAKTSVEGDGFEELNESVKVKEVTVENIGQDIMIKAYIDKQQ